jgi:hypothetical protein
MNIVIDWLTWRAYRDPVQIVPRQACEVDDEGYANIVSGLAQRELHRGHIDHLFLVSHPGRSRAADAANEIVALLTI